MAAMPMRLIEVQSMGQDLAQKTVCVKVRLGRLGNTRKVSNAQVEVDTDKSLLLISKHLLDSKELRTIASFDGEIRRYLYDTCLPFEAGIHLCPLPLYHKMTVLCGHTHSPGFAQILDNLEVRTGGAQYGEPALQRVWELE